VQKFRSDTSQIIHHVKARSADIRVRFFVPATPKHRSAEADRNVRAPIKVVCAPARGEATIRLVIGEEIVIMVGNAKPMQVGANKSEPPASSVRLTTGNVHDDT